MFRRHAHVRQNGQSDCGPAALAAVALHYRRPLSLEQLRGLAGTDRVGTSLLGLRDAAERLGFTAKGVCGPFEALRDVPLPAIAHVRNDEGQGHFVVIHRVKKRSVLVADPGKDEVESESREDFCKRWDGYLLLLIPDPGRQAAPPGSQGVSPTRRFAGLLRGHVPLLTEAFFCALLMTALGVSTSFYIQHLVDSVLVRQEGNLLTALGIGMVLVVVFRTLFGMLRQYLLAHISRKIDLTLVVEYTRHLLRLPMSFFETRQVGEILSRVRDTDKVRDAISGMTLTAVVDATVVGLILAVLWIYDWPLALVTTLFVPLLIVNVIAFHPISRRRSREQLEQTAKFSSHLVEDIHGVETLKACGAERFRAEELESSLVRVERAAFSIQKLGLTMTAIGTLVTGLAGVVILWYGGVRVMAGLITTGQLMFFYSLMNTLLEPLQRLASVNVKFQEALTAVDRIYQFLEMEPERKDDSRSAGFDGLADGITLQGVGFRYGRRGNVLEEVDLRIPAGWTVGVVGESGSGKSTLLKLLMGYHEPTSGRVLYDGVDVRDIDLEALRGRIGLVSQEPFIFNGTIRDNIALSAPGASLGEVAEAARAAGLDDFISRLPDRYATMIGERGVNLSGGQRQRLAIARALVRKPDILLFDEATSHLDTATERAIQQNLDGALSGKTVVVVAHRLSTIKDADTIYVFDQGRVVEHGSHRQLLERDGRYAALWKAQTDDTPDRDDATPLDIPGLFDGTAGNDGAWWKGGSYA